MKENDSIIIRGLVAWWLGGLVAWCEKKCIDEVLGKWSFVVNANGFNQVDVLLVFEPSLVPSFD